MTKTLQDLRFAYIGTVGEKRVYTTAGALINYNELMRASKEALEAGMSLEEFMTL